MSARLRGIAQQTEEIVAAGRYVSAGGRDVAIAHWVDAARSGTRLFGPAAVRVTPPEPISTVVEVTAESSLEAARRLTTRENTPVAVLNFSSARNPGGGYLNGAQAQEEALCRASALYTCVRSAREFYDHHRAHRDPFYSDRVIHSPAVPVFRDDRGRLLDEAYTVGFLTSAAPNAGVVRRQTPERAGQLPDALLGRAERVLETAVACGYRRLVLGAWGCGVFQNDPVDVADAFRVQLDEGGRFHGAFEHIVFGVLDRTRGAVTRAAFEEAFGKGFQGAAQRQP
ncbi:TIGR02452 family protein [Streptomyces sp. MZ04]|uniref:TIGR02452 family protein n=1 Tax=Streptomyces sp. MZ04 TaxID=2559236 RepID=UPI00107E870C|nr:TIGR02452 family protein [Streptomyces sp. MZ04]TGA96488.1 TIGR02452 family protein [Streptomyces sp. MZ04]